MPSACDVMMPKLEVESKRCIPIIGPSEQQVRDQLERAIAIGDMIEVRCDGVDPAIFSKCPLPLIFMLRGVKEIPKKILALQPAYIDLDVSEIFPLPKGIGLICSHHNFEATPDDLKGEFARLRKHPAEIYKLATKAHSAIDALRMIEASQAPDAIGVAMGDAGKLSRLYSSGPWTYAMLDEESASASGQMTTCELSKKEIFGLVGDPISQSQSMAFHNAIFEEEERSAIYLPFRVPAGQLGNFLHRFRFKGLSVTMPHKEAILPFLDDVHGNVAVNTVVCRGDRLHGFNTDGLAAIDALGVPVKGRRIAILGAGGAAKAIAAEGRKRGASVALYHRKEMERLGDHDILIQCTPVDMPIKAEQIVPGTLVMEIITRTTSFVHAAKERGCDVIEGMEMFRRQALMQQEIWRD